MNILLGTHIRTGTIALLGAAVAILSAKEKRVHILSGRAYFWGMATIFLSAISIKLLREKSGSPDIWVI